MNFSLRNMATGVLLLGVLVLAYFRYVVPGPPDTSYAGVSSDNSVTSTVNVPSTTRTTVRPPTKTTQAAPVATTVIHTESPPPTGTPEATLPGKVPPAVQAGLSKIFQEFYSQPAKDTSPSRLKRLAKVLPPPVVSALNAEDKNVSGDGSVITPSFRVQDMQASGTRTSLYVVAQVTLTIKGGEISQAIYNSGSQWQWVPKRGWTITSFTSQLLSSS